jgi:uncharacterized protein (DUF2267 family)
MENAMGALLERVRVLGGLDTTSEASNAVRATVIALGERLKEDERRVLASALPAPLGRRLRSMKRSSTFDVAEFYERVRKRERVSAGFAREHAQAVCRSLSEVLPPGARQTLDEALPESIAELFHPLSFGGSPPAHPVQGHTLATGRPGSNHPLSESHPHEGQAHSVVLEANPHGDRKLSSAS